ncbi:MAG TPA: GDSL-type esterase/lipase family protein, partial [Solirubrobacteraceae bacterium]|nr:GDSL-type esterase/lipase family protein [Solirubrobacteraceae bacterium]
MSAPAQRCRKGLVALGDSITLGEGSMALGITPLSWAQWLARALDLAYTSYAFNGATTAEILHEQLPRVRFEYDVATLYAGVNDVRSPSFDAAAYERDLDAVAAALAQRSARLLMLTLPED